MDYNDYSTESILSPCCKDSVMCHASGKINSVRTSLSKAAHYQRLKRIQNTVRVASSLYAMNLASLSAYQKPDKDTQVILNASSPYIAGGGVNWNQMSDRKVPHVQKVVTASPGKSSTRHTITRLRPGAGSPGGIGVDIKHNCYERYLNRIKAKPNMRGSVGPQFGEPIDFNRAVPIYGGKTMKTSIVNGCNECSDKNTELLYEMDCGVQDVDTAILEPVPVPVRHYNVGDFVWVHKCKRLPKREKAQIISISEDMEQYVIKFSDCCIATKRYSDIQPLQTCTPNLFAIAYVNNGVVNVCDYFEMSKLNEITGT
jgi:hypothetical protein